MSRNRDDKPFCKLFLFFFKKYNMCNEADYTNMRLEHFRQFVKWLIENKEFFQG